VAKRAYVQQLKNPAVAREDALQPIQFLYWPSRSSKFNDFHLS